MSDALPIAPEELFQHAEFLKHLARRLLKDEQLAEDVAQEALVAAWRDPPRERGALRTFLARTAHRLALNRRASEAGRTRRERASARPERQDPERDALERLELQRLVFEQVLALDEAKRTALFLRYHEGLEPAAIAARLDVPLKTVKTRLARGLAELRERLERRYEGDRRALALALLDLARGPAASVAAGGISGALVAKVGAGLATAVLVVWIAWPKQAASGQPRELGRLGDRVLIARPEGTTETRQASEVAREAVVPDGPTRASFALTGSVRRREDGTPISGAEVEVLTWRPVERLTLTTDADGRFRLERSEPWNVSSLLARATADTTAATLALGKRLRAAEPLEVELWVTQGATLSARVVDTAGNPVAGATVRAWCRESFDPEKPVDRMTTTRADGRFTLEHLGEPFTLDAEKAGLACLYGLRGVLASGSIVEGIEVVMDEAAWLRGRVEDERGRPIAGAELTSEPYLSSSSSDATSVLGVQRFYAHKLRTESARDGSFELGPVPPRAWGVRVSHDEFLGTDLSIDPEAEARIVLAAGHRLAGVVLDAAGKPLAGASVHVHPEFAREQRATTDADGRFEVQALVASEEGYILVSAPGHALFARQPFPVGPGAPGFVELRLEPEAPLAGRVLDEQGRPVPEARVKAEGDRLLEIEAEFGEPKTWEWRAACNEVWTDGEGWFRFERLYPGSFLLRASPPDAPELCAELRTRSGREDVEIVIDRAALERVVFAGVVRDGRTGDPLTDFTVTPSVETGEGTTMGHARTFGPAARGAFRIAGHAAGTYTLEVSAPGYGRWFEALREYREGEHRFAVSLWPACTLRMRVQDERGRPLMAHLVFHDLDGRRLRLDNGTLRSSSIIVSGDEEVVAGLPRHVVRATASAEGHHETTVDLDLTVPPLEPVVITLTSVAGHELASFGLLVLLTDDPVVSASTDAETLRAAFLEGRARMLDVPAGIDFLDHAGTRLAQARLERDDEGRLVSTLAVGSTSISSQVTGNGVSLRLPVKVRRARFQAEGCRERELGLALDPSEPTLVTVALLEER
ncbi:MAG TPA: sigma-70 family RNA polymerase sigma factor [Planctomycetota bacterium]